MKQLAPGAVSETSTVLCAVERLDITGSAHGCTLATSLNKLKLFADPRIERHIKHGEHPRAPGKGALPPLRPFPASARSVASSFRRKSESSYSSSRRRAAVLGSGLRRNDVVGARLAPALRDSGTMRPDRP